MKCDKRYMLLYAVTDRAWTGKQTLYQQVEAALKGGVTCVQLREKELDKAAFLQEARDICALCRRYGVPFIVNDHVDIAAACGADGVHVGQEDMEAGEVRRRVGENMILGVSVHTVEEARQAVRDGADYLGLGAVFPTNTKTDVEQMPNETLWAICEAVDTLKSCLLPLVAVVTPNIPKAEILSGMTIRGQADIENAAKKSAAHTAVLSCSKAGITSMTPTIFSMRTVRGPGSVEPALIPPTRTAPAVPCPAPLLPIWQRALTCPHPSSGRKITSLVRWGLC